MNQPHGTLFHIIQGTVNEAITHKHSHSKKESVEKNGKRFGGGPYILVARFVVGFVENLENFAGFELEGFVVGSITLKFNAQQRQPLQDRSQIEVRPDATMARTVRQAVQSIRLESASLVQPYKPSPGSGWALASEDGELSPKRNATHPTQDQMISDEACASQR